MILDGTAVAKKIQQKIKHDISNMQERPPCLACVIATDNPASVTYVRRKVKMCEEVGILSRVIDFRPKHTKDLLVELHALNRDHTVDGILVQLPLPHDVNPLDIFEYIDPSKDVDGFHPLHVGKVLLGNPDTVYPCTPLGIKTLLDHYNISVASKRVVIVGRSNIVGKPLAAMLMQNSPRCNATVTVAHSQTTNLKELCLEADILVAAIGIAQYITADMVKPGAVVVDVGLTKVDGRILGDVDFPAVSKKCSAITPVPGGIGPMTIAMLLQNTFKSYLTHVQ